MRGIFPVTRNIPVYLDTVLYFKYIPSISNPSKLICFCLRKCYLKGQIYEERRSFWIYIYEDTYYWAETKTHRWSISITCIALFIHCHVLSWQQFTHVQEKQVACNHDVLFTFPIAINQLRFREMADPTQKYLFQSFLSHSLYYTDP